MIKRYKMLTSGEEMPDAAKFPRKRQRDTEPTSWLNETAPLDHDHTSGCEAMYGRRTAAKRVRAEDEESASDSIVSRASASWRDLPATDILEASPAAPRRWNSRATANDLAKLSQPEPFCFYRDLEWMPVNSCTTVSGTIVPGSQVKLSCGGFIEVRSILISQTDEMLYIVGWRYEDLRSLGNMVDHRDSHVCLILDDVADEMLDDEENVYIAPATSIERTVRIVRTNKMDEDLDATHHQARLPTYLCWLKRIAPHNDRDWDANKGSDCALVMLTASDCANSRYAEDDQDVRERFRGETVRGGASSGLSTLECTRYNEEYLLDVDANQKLREVSIRGIWAVELRRRQFPTLPVGKQNKISTNNDLIQCCCAAPGSKAAPITFEGTNTGCSQHNASPTDSFQHDDECSISKLSQSFNGSFNQADDYWRRTTDTETRCMDLSVRRYTFGDAFCGGGGMSRGAVEAGLCLKWAFDKEMDMCETYHHNFPWVRVAQTAAHDFATNIDYEAKVDILHISPVCKPFSPAHTIDGQDDEENIACLFVIGELLKKAKPRIATLEQTGGLTHNKHLKYRDAAIRQFVTHGFSVRWRVFDLADFGVPQHRQRLLIIASCPGEPLPPFPPITHGDPRQLSTERQALRPWNSINDAIVGTIPETWSLHSIERTQKSGPNCRLMAFDGDRTLAKVLTCKGGTGNNHPSGTRKYTLRELATLQTFPVYHDFKGSVKQTRVKEQIGNAVPPIVGKVFCEHIDRWLRKVDEVEENSA